MYGCPARALITQIQMNEKVLHAVHVWLEWCKRYCCCTLLINVYTVSTWVRIAEHIDAGDVEVKTDQKGAICTCPTLCQSVNCSLIAYSVL